MAEKMSRAKKQAIYEINVVKSCRENYLEKLEEIKKMTEEISAQIGVLLERGRLSSSETEQKELAREIKKLRICLDMMKKDEEHYRNDVDMFDRFVILLDAFYRNERFRYIVKMIPERKLARMVKNPNKHDKVTAILTSLFKEFNNAIQKFVIDVHNEQEEWEHITKVGEIFDERNERADKELDSIMDEFKSSNATEDAEDVSTETAKRKKINS